MTCNSIAFKSTIASAGEGSLGVGTVGIGITIVGICLTFVDIFSEIMKKKKVQVSQKLVSDHKIVNSQIGIGIVDGLRSF